jgi:hypothetical protein
MHSTRVAAVALSIAALSSLGLAATSAQDEHAPWVTVSTTCVNRCPSANWTLVGTAAAPVSESTCGESALQLVSNTAGGGQASYIYHVDGSVCIAMACNYATSDFALGVVNAQPRDRWLGPPMRFVVRRAAAAAVCSRLATCNSAGRAYRVGLTGACSCACDAGFTAADCSMPAGMGSMSDELIHVLSITDGPLALSTAEMRVINETVMEFFDSAHTTDLYIQQTLLPDTFHVAVSLAGDAAAAAQTLNFTLMNEYTDTLRRQLTPRLELVEVSPTASVRGGVTFDRFGPFSPADTTGRVFTVSADASSRIQSIALSFPGADTPSTVNVTLTLATPDGNTTASCTLQRRDVYEEDRSCARELHCDVTLVPHDVTSVYVHLPPSATLSAACASSTFNATTVATLTQEAHPPIPTTDVRVLGSHTLKDESGFKAVIVFAFFVAMLQLGNVIHVLLRRGRGVKQSKIVKGTAGLMAIGSVWAFAIALFGLITIGDLDTLQSHVVVAYEYTSELCNSSDVNPTPRRVAAFSALNGCRPIRSVGVGFGAFNALGLCHPDTRSASISMTGSRSECVALPTVEVPLGECLHSPSEVPGFWMFGCVPEREVTSLFDAFRTRFGSSTSAGKVDRQIARAVAIDDRVFGRENVTVAFREDSRLTGPRLHTTAKGGGGAAVAFVDNSDSSTAAAVQYARVLSRGEPPGGNHGDSNATGVRFDLADTPLRYTHIHDTAFDVGNRGSIDTSEEGEFTITFWIQADRASQGIVFAMADDVVVNAENVITNELLAAFLSGDMSRPIASATSFQVYFAVMISGARQVLAIGRGAGQGPPTIREWTLDGVELTNIFDGNWHHIAITASALLSRRYLHLFIDGRTSYRSSEYMQCLASGEDFKSVQQFTAGTPVGTPNFGGAQPRVTTSGSLVTGAFGGSLYGVEAHRKVLSHQEVAALGTAWMKHDARIYVTESRVLAIILLTFFALALIVSVLQLAQEFRQARNMAAAAMATTVEGEEEAGGAQTSVVKVAKESKSIAQAGAVQAGQAAMTVQGAAAAMPATAGAAGSATIAQSLLQIAVIIPIMNNVMQSMLLYFGSWQWPIEFEVPFSLAFFSFSLDFAVSFPSIPVEATYATQFVVVLCALALLYVLATSDDKRFVANVIAPMQRAMLRGESPFSAEEANMPQPNYDGDSLPGALRVYIADTEVQGFASQIVASELAGRCARRAMTQIRSELVKGSGDIVPFAAPLETPVMPLWLKLKRKRDGDPSAYIRTAVINARAFMGTMMAVDQSEDDDSSSDDGGVTNPTSIADLFRQFFVVCGVLTMHSEYVKLFLSYVDVSDIIEGLKTFRNAIDRTMSSDLAKWPELPAYVTLQTRSLKFYKSHGAVLESLGVAIHFAMKAAYSRFDTAVRQRWRTIVNETVSDIAVAQALCDWGNGLSFEGNPVWSTFRDHTVKRIGEEENQLTRVTAERFPFQPRPAENRLNWSLLEKCDRTIEDDDLLKPPPLTEDETPPDLAQEFENYFFGKSDERRSVGLAVFDILQPMMDDAGVTFRKSSAADMQLFERLLFSDKVSSLMEIDSVRRLSASDVRDLLMTLVCVHNIVTEADKAGIRRPAYAWLERLQAAVVAGNGKHNSPKNVVDEFLARERDAHISCAAESTNVETETITVNVDVAEEKLAEEKLFDVQFEESYMVPNTEESSNPPHGLLRRADMIQVYREMMEEFATVFTEFLEAEHERIQGRFDYEDSVLLQGNFEAAVAPKTVRDVRIETAQKDGLLTLDDESRLSVDMLFKPVAQDRVYFDLQANGASSIRPYHPLHAACRAADPRAGCAQGTPRQQLGYIRVHAAAVAQF